MNHLAIAPIVLAALSGALLLALHKVALPVMRTLSLAATGAFLVAALALFAQTSGGEPLVYGAGNWPAPFGIILVADRLSALMVLLTAVLALAVLIYAVHGWDARGRFFHPLLQFQLMGLAGAFLTGDLFNLFVFFEVMLIASYCLMIQGLGKDRLRATLHYVAINLTSSSVFLIGVGLLYGLTGTVNMAHLGERIASAPATDLALIRAAGLLLMAVFCIKAAVFPLSFWLPPAYGNAAAPVAALFAIMTKVGVYAILRLTTLIYGGEAGHAGSLVTPWLLPVALATLTLGALGALGAKRLAVMVAFVTVGSVGTMLTAVSAGGTAGISAALYYLVDSTLVLGLLFLLVDLLGRQRGAIGDALHAGPALRAPVLLSLAFLLGATIVAGVPPTSGFVGKLMVLQSVRDAASAPAAWSFLFVSSFLLLIGFARAGSLMLWKTSDDTPRADAQAPRAGEWLALGVLGTCSVLLVLLANPAKRYVDATAADLGAPSAYIDAVLGRSRSDFIRPMPDATPR
ncbi:MAG: monovalent cation/H+ antiporter subunit D [Casimicrobiaceae bacterium]